jgi:hypothetical protein
VCPGNMRDLTPTLASTVTSFERSPHLSKRLRTL